MFYFIQDFRILDFRASETVFDLFFFTPSSEGFDT